MSNTQQTTWLESLTVYFKPRVVAMFFLGFSAGLPFPLVFTTLTGWLNNAGLSKTAIGFFSWIGITYSIKVFWSPVVDRIPIPILSNLLGQRRSWLLLSQIGIASGLIVMTIITPQKDLALFALSAVWVAFCSATQDIAIDAYRIEAVEPQYQGAMAGAYQTGWRIAASLIGGAIALKLSDFYNWEISYQFMAGFALVGFVTTLIIKEPEHKINKTTMAMEKKNISEFLDRYQNLPPLISNTFAWFIGAVVSPIKEFFTRCGKWALLLLFFIGIYRLSDITLSSMAIPFYQDLGFSNDEIANISKIYGVILTIAGALLGGFSVTRFGTMRPLLVGAILVAVTNLLFSVMATKGHDTTWLIVVISADNFSGGLAGSAFIAYLSRLTNTAYTATQYALFSSLMTLPAKFQSGFSGVIVDAQGFIFFFQYVAALGIPAIITVLVLMKLLNIDDQETVKTKLEPKDV